MKFNVRSAKALGNPNETGWVQVHDFTPEDKEKLKTRGRIFALISVRKKESAGASPDMITGGREVLSRLHEEYYGKKEISAFNGLKRAVKKISSEFSSWGDIQIAAASLVDGVLYTAVVGGGEVSIFRKGSLATILKGQSGVAAASGYPEDEDLFTLSTNGLLDKIGRGVVTAALSGKDLNETTENLSGKIHSMEGSEIDGFTVIGFFKKEILQRLSPDLPQEEKEEGVEETGLKKTLWKFPVKFKRKRIRKREVSVEDLQKKKTTLSVSILVLALLVISIVFGIRQQKIREREGVFNEKISEAIYNLEEAKALFSLSPERARELFSESKKIVEELENSGFKAKELEEIKKELQAGKEAVLGEFDVTDELFLDTSPISDNFTSDVMSGSGNSIALLDVSGRRVAIIEIDTKRTEVVSGPTQIKDARDVALYESRPFVLERDGIYEVGNAKILSVEKEWSDNVLMSVYAGNLYVLDKNSSDITRFSGVGVDFGEGSSWLAPGIKLDLSKIVSMGINGSIWILSSSGRIEKYTQGSPDVLNLAITPALLNPAKIYTDSELKFVYILDPENSRIVVLERDGKYKAQYVNERLGKAQNFMVSENEELIIFLEENKLYSLKTRF